MKTFETFNELKGYTISQLTKKEPSCFNGMVDIEKYKVTIEKIEESKEVYRERLQKMWDECDNHHNWNPLKAKAEQMGIELQGDSGSKRKQK